MVTQSSLSGLRRGPQRSQSGARWWDVQLCVLVEIVGETDVTVDEAGVGEVEEHAEPVVATLEVSEELRLVDVDELIDHLQFDDNALFDEQIDELGIRKLSVTVPNGHRYLPTYSESPMLELSH